MKFGFCLLLISLLSSPAFTQGAGNIIKLDVCLIENGELKVKKGEYNTSTGIKLVEVNGKKLRADSLHVNNSDYARNFSWYINNEGITVNNQYYEKYGLPRVLGANEIEKFAKYQTVGVYREKGMIGDAEVIYIPIQGECEFQPYQKSLPPCNVKLEISHSIDRLKLPLKVQFKAPEHAAIKEPSYNWQVYGGESESTDDPRVINVIPRENGKSVSVYLYIMGRNCKQMLEKLVKLD
jgi:hypothetical protein